MRVDERRVPDLLVEQLALGELPEARAAEVRARLAREPGGADRLAAIARSDADILAAYPAAEVAPAIARRASSARRAQARRRRGWAIGIATAAAAVALAVLAPRPDGAIHGISPPLPGGDWPAHDTRTKGSDGTEPGLTVFVHRPTGPAQLEPGDPLRAGDRIQLRYRAAGRAWGVILSIDGRGEVVAHLPDRPRGLAELRADGEVALPFAYELDDAPSFERFILVVGREPFDAGAVWDAAEALAEDPAAARARALSLPPGAELVSVLIAKEESP